jgi:hypothetical protein
VARAGEGQRRGARAAAGLGATHRSCQSRRWRQQSCSGGERRRPATARWRLGRAAKRHGVLGESQQEGGEAVGELGDDARRPGEAEGGPRAAWHGGQRQRCCTAEGEQRKKKGGAARGGAVNFKNSRDLTVTQNFPPF